MQVYRVFSLFKDEYVWHTEFMLVETESPLIPPAVASVYKQTMLVGGVFTTKCAVEHHLPV